MIHICSIKSCLKLRKRQRNRVAAARSPPSYQAYQVSAQLHCNSVATPDAVWPWQRTNPGWNTWNTQAKM